MTIHESETIDLDAPTTGISPVPCCGLGDILSGRYRLEAEIGRGGMGVVFRAWDVELERPVAVKVLASSLEAGEARDRLFREARAAAALSHPNVVAVHDVGEHQAMPYFVMELVDGQSLRQSKPETLEEILEVARQICDALGHAHAHDLVHRDLKPANVLLDGRPGRLSVKIVDLGLAVRGHGVHITREGGITGTVSYMAPEQALGREVDGRADLYALGVMLYELTAGRLPFEGDNALAVLSQHLHAPVVPPRTYRADLPEHIEAVILRLLAKDPGDRFANAAEVADVLTLSPGAGAVLAPAGVAGVLDGLVRGRLVGRDTEIAALRRSWSQAAGGRGGMVLVSGEPGAGKTRLARELVDYARITGGVVLSGGCYELEAATPYLPFVEALRTWVRTSPDDQLRRAVGTAGGELARLAPELEGRIGPFPAGPELPAAERRLLLFDGVARCLFNLAAPRGLLLLIDDLQWADQASLSLLHYLVRLIGRERLLILGCSRETDLDRSHPLADPLDTGNRERTAVTCAPTRGATIPPPSATATSTSATGRRPRSARSPLGTPPGGSPTWSATAGSGPQPSSRRSPASSPTSRPTPATRPTSSTASTTSCSAPRGRRRPVSSAAASATGSSATTPTCSPSSAACTGSRRSGPSFRTEPLLDSRPGTGTDVGSRSRVVAVVRAVAAPVRW